MVSKKLLNELNRTKGCITSPKHRYILISSSSLIAGGIYLSSPELRAFDQDGYCEMVIKATCDDKRLPELLISVYDQFEDRLLHVEDYKKLSFGRTKDGRNYCKYVFTLYEIKDNFKGDSEIPF